MLICLDELNREIRAFLGNLLKQWISIIDEILTNTQQNCSANHFITLCTIFPYLTLPLFSIRFSKLFESWVCELKVQ